MFCFNNPHLPKNPLNSLREDNLLQGIPLLFIFLNEYMNSSFHIFNVFHFLKVFLSLSLFFVFIFTIFSSLTFHHYLIYSLYLFTLSIHFICEHFICVHFICVHFIFLFKHESAFRAKLYVILEEKIK